MGWVGRRGVLHSPGVGVLHRMCGALQLQLLAYSTAGCGVHSDESLHGMQAHCSRCAGMVRVGCGATKGQCGHVIGAEFQFSLEFMHWRVALHSVRVSCDGTEDSSGNCVWVFGWFEL